MSLDLVQKMNWRYAVKKFDSKRIVPKEVMNELLECLRLAPSSFGLQPWKFLVITSSQIKRNLRVHSWNQSQIEDCSHLVVFCRKKSFGAKEVNHFIESMSSIRSQPTSKFDGYKKVMTDFCAAMSEDELRSWMNKQIYIALGELLTTTAVLDIDACPIEGFSSKKYDEELKLADKGLESVVVCAVGYRSPEDAYQNEKKVRFSSEEVFDFL